LDTAWQSELARLAILVKRRRLAPSFYAVSSKIPQSSFDLGPIRKNPQAYKKEGAKDDADKNHPYQTLAYPNGGGRPVLVCRACLVWWSVDGKYLALQFGLPPNEPRTYLLPVNGGRGLPDLPPEGLVGPEDLKESNRGVVLPTRVDSVIGPEKYSYTKANIRRNIYRIPIS